MAKVTLEFDSYEDKEELEMTLSAGKYYSALWEIKESLFRGYRKHGYSGVSGEQLNKLIEDEKVYDAIEILETMFYGILEDGGVEL